MKRPARQRQGPLRFLRLCPPLTCLILLLVDNPDETDALAGEGLYEALLLAIVTDRTASAIDAGRKRELRDNPSIPDRGDQFVAAYNALPVADQI